MPSEARAMMEGHVQAVALVAAAHRAYAAGQRLPWDKIDEIARGDCVREALASLASMAALTIRLVDDGVQLPTADFLDLLAATCTDLIDEES